MSSWQPVDVYVYRADSGHEPIPGVVVRVYDALGTTLYGDSTTDALGHAGFLLWTNRYTLRFNKFQARITQPQVIDVLEGPSGAVADNTFTVHAEMLGGEHARDPLLCRASGFFRDITGAPHRNLDILFVGNFSPILLDGAGVVSERRMIRTGEDGFACVDLIRCAQYSATVEGLEDQLRTIAVPNAPSVNLPDLLFPTARSVSFDLPSPWTLSVGSTLALSPTVTTSTGIVLEGVSPANVVYATEDPSVAVAVVATPTTIQLRGVAQGSTRLLVRRLDSSIVSLPYRDGLIGSGQTINVS